MSENTSSSSGTSTTGLFLGLASLSAGAYHGYMDAQGFPIEKESLESALTWGPMMVRGGLGAIVGGIAGFMGGGAVGAGATYGGLSDRLKGGSVGAAAGSAVGAGVGGTYGAIVGGFQTVIGYGVGYAAGVIAR